MFVKNTTPVIVVLTFMLSFIVMLTLLSYFYKMSSGYFNHFNSWASPAVITVTWCCLQIFGFGFCLVAGYYHGMLFFHMVLELEISWPESIQESILVLVLLSDLFTYSFVLLVVFLALRGVFNSFFYLEFAAMLSVLGVICCVKKLTVPVIDIDEMLMNCTQVCMFSSMLYICYLEYQMEKMHEFFLERLYTHLFVWYLIMGFLFLICVDLLSPPVFLFLVMTMWQGYEYMLEHTISQAFVKL